MPGSLGRAHSAQVPCALREVLFEESQRGMRLQRKSPGFHALSPVSEMVPGHEIARIRRFRRAGASGGRVGSAALFELLAGRPRAPSGAVPRPFKRASRIGFGRLGSALVFGPSAGEAVFGEARDSDVPVPEAGESSTTESAFSRPWPCRYPRMIGECLSLHNAHGRILAMPPARVA